MNKNLLILFSLYLFTLPMQAQQMQNASFEDWEDAGTVIDEPVNWSSIKTSDAGSFINNAAPVVWGQSSDAHTGNYSLELTNVLTIGTIIATGTVTNGRIHASFNTAEAYSFTNIEDSRWNTPLNARPDSVAVWIKYFPQGGDTAQVKVLLHNNNGSIPLFTGTAEDEIAFAQINVVGEHATWTRVAAPFTYSSQAVPEYALMILTAGAGLIPIEGSVALYDDVELVYNPASVANHLAGKDLLYAYGATLYLDKLPADYRRDARVEIIGLNGSTLWSTDVSSDRVQLDRSQVSEGLYVVQVRSAEGIYSQKIHIGR